MLEPMTVQVEVWPVAADDAGLWLVSGDDAWRCGPVMADGDVHFEVEGLMWEHGVAAGTAVIHSTSWRAEGTSVVLTYMAAVRVEGFARDRWPDAMPVTPALAAAVGRPPAHAPTEPPAPRFVDVLLHGLRHLAFLRLYDVPASEALPEHWHEHLRRFEPALAGMYRSADAGVA